MGMQQLMQMMAMPTPAKSGCTRPACKWCAMGECWDSRGAQRSQGFAPIANQGVKSGDWICPSCGDHQYARNDECRKCGEPKPDEGIVQKNSSAPLLPGDWICSECGDHQFGR